MLRICPSRTRRVPYNFSLPVRLLRSAAFPAVLLRSLASCVLILLGGPVSALTAPGQPQQDPEALAGLATAFLRSHAGHEPDHLGISVQLPDTRHLPACTQPEPFIRDGRALQARMSVGVRCLAPKTWTIYLQANISLHGSYYTTTRTIQAGEAVGPEDLLRREGDIFRISRDVVRDPTEAIGYIASQRIPAGTPLKARTLHSPASIARGQRVRTETRGNGFVASGEGLALGSGSPGSQIQVRTRSGHIITGTIIDAHTVLVPY